MIGCSHRVASDVPACWRVRCLPALLCACPSQITCVRSFRIGVQIRFDPLFALLLCITRIIQVVPAHRVHEHGAVRPGAEGRPGERQAVRGRLRSGPAYAAALARLIACFVARCWRQGPTAVCVHRAPCFGAGWCFNRPKRRRIGLFLCLGCLQSWGARQLLQELPRGTLWWSPTRTHPPRLPPSCRTRLARPEW